MTRAYLVTLEIDTEQREGELRDALRDTLEQLPPWIAWWFQEWQDPAQTQLDVSGE